MLKRWSRRRFLGTTLAGTAVMGAAGIAKESQNPAKSSGGLDRESLRAAMDEIIPAGDGMPSVTAVGGLEYLEDVSLREPEIKSDLQKALEALESLSQSRLHTGFAKITSPQRIEVLSALEARSPELFARLRDHVYEAYYVQPRVWKLIGYDFHPTNEAGPHMKPFDESVLAKVRKMPKLYRDAG